MKGKYLITTDAYFLAPDGQEYRGAYGNIEVLSDGILGVSTNRNSSNWFVKIGSEDKHVIIAGCQIHYAVKSKEKPCLKGSKYFDSNVDKYTEHLGLNKIYIAE